MTEKTGSSSKQEAALDASSSLIDLLIPYCGDEVKGIDFRKALTDLARENKEALPFIYEKITSGNDLSQRLAKSEFINYIVASEYSKGHAGRAGVMMTGVASRWHLGNVLIETGTYTQDSEVLGDLAALNACDASLYHAGYVPFHVKKGNTEAWYWRGVSALIMCVDVYSREFKSHYISHVFPFVEYAGRHSNISEVITIAKKHDDLNPEVIEELIKQRAETHGALKDGVI